VKYVLEGGVQRAGTRVRITAQLVDAGSGYHIWAERYDRELGDIFVLQDEVTQQIVRALAVKLSEAERGRIARAPTSDLAAYDLVLRGQKERLRTTREGNVAARELYSKAVDLDPRYAAAYLGLSWTYLQSWQFLWSSDPETLERARQLAERAIALDEGLGKGYGVLAQIYLWRKEHDRAIAQAERAVALAPNDADGYETLAEVFGWSGRPADSLRLIQQAMRLNPHYPFFYLWTVAHDYYLTERRQEALATLDKLVERNPNFLPAPAYRAVLYSELGQDKRAREAWNRARELSPGASVETIRQHLPYRQQADLDRFMRGIEKAMAH